MAISRNSNSISTDAEKLAGFSYVMYIFSIIANMVK